MPLTDRTDAELFADAAAIREEQVRRANLAAIPGQIKDLAGKYREGGGDEDALNNAISGGDI